VLFIGTQFSILYTSMYSPAEAATRSEKVAQTGVAIMMPAAGGEAMMIIGFY